MGIIQDDKKKYSGRSSGREIDLGREAWMDGVQIPEAEENRLQPMATSVGMLQTAAKL